MWILSLRNDFGRIRKDDTWNKNKKGSGDVFGGNFWVVSYKWDI